MRGADIPKDRALDSQLALSLIGRDAPHDLIVNRDFVTRIGNLCDVSFVRKLNISFNSVKSLDGIDQLPQLKQLLAYACGTDKIECLKAISKIESVLLQQNKISKMGDTFSGMSKLLELRLDQNRIGKIEGLNGCVSLRKLDLSFNNIESLTGISGLQQLQELKVSNNAVKSLLPLKALPSIKDLDVSNNQLRNLDGLNQMPTLEYVKADHNLIAELKLLPMLGASKKPTASAASEPVGKEKASAKAANASAKKDKNALAEVADLSGPMLLELSVSGNRIRSVQGLEVYKLSLETLDLSSNNVSSAGMSDLVLALKPCRALSELRLHLNPICDDDGVMDTLVAELSVSCPSLRAIDGLAIVANSDIGYSGKGGRSVGTAGSQQPGAYAAAMERVGGICDASTLASGSQFHTWNDDGTSVGDNAVADEGQETVKDEATEKDEFSDDESSSDNEKEKKSAEEGAKRYPHNLLLKEMLTPEEIEAKAQEIRNGLKSCRDKLEKATRTVFGFAEEEDSPQPVGATVSLASDAPKEGPQQARRTASGARVARAIEQAAESLSRKHSAVAAFEAVMDATPAPLPEKVVMKEKLVDRVRMAVSNSAATFGTSPDKASAEVTAASHRPRTTEGVPIGLETMPATVKAQPVPNNPLLTDEMAASFRLHREAYAKEAATQRAEPTSPQRSPATDQPGGASPTVVSPGSVSESKASHSKGRPAGSHLPVNPLGSGLTRHGTKIRSGDTTATLVDPTNQSNISILRAAGGAVESLDILNLRITKPSQQVYMTEWPEEGASQKATAAQPDGDSGEEGCGESDDDGSLYDRGDPRELDPVEEGEEQDDDDHHGVETTAAPQEVLFHEVRTRPEDRFGRALAGVGGAGYDPRAVRRGTVAEMEHMVGGRPVTGEDGKQGLLKRGHSAPTMETASLDATAGQVDKSDRYLWTLYPWFHICVAPNHGFVALSHHSEESPPLSPAISIGAFSMPGLTSTTVGGYQAPKRARHGGAATMVVATATATAAAGNGTGANVGSISPRPQVANTSQPKM